jgi:hypothetical protein
LSAKLLSRGFIFSLEESVMNNPKMIERPETVFIRLLLFIRIDKDAEPVLLVAGLKLIR